MTPSLLDICDSTQRFRSIMSIRLAVVIYVEPENGKVTYTLLFSLSKLSLPLPLLTLPLVVNCCPKTEKSSQGQLT